MDQKRSRESLLILAGSRETWRPYTLAPQCAVPIVRGRHQTCIHCLTLAWAAAVPHGLRLCVGVSPSDSPGKCWHRCLAVSPGRNTTWCGTEPVLGECCVHVLGEMLAEYGLTGKVAIGLSDALTGFLLPVKMLSSKAPTGILMSRSSGVVKATEGCYNAEGLCARHAELC